MRLFFILLTFCASAAQATPKVLTDIAPVQAIVADVMGDLATPDVLLPPFADAHDYALKPSDARRVANAELFIWVGPMLTPWLEKPLQALGSDTPPLVLSSHEDPHEWLDPDYAADWAVTIADRLAKDDPENAATYLANAEAAIARYGMLKTEILQMLDPVKDNALLWPHDGFRFFEAAFELNAVGAIADAHAHAPGPAHIAELVDIVANDEVFCILLDAEVGEDWLTPLGDLGDIKTAVIDPLGNDIAQGAGFYTQLIRDLGEAVSNCLAP